MKRPWIALSLALSGSVAQPGYAESFVKNEQDRARIEQALPVRAPAPPKKPRRLLIFTLNVGYGGHPSMAYANEAFTLMGKKTGAFETTVTNDPAVFQRESLRHYDAVFFNNTVGNCFTNSDLRRDLIEFITGGGGLMGVHGSAVAFTQWPGAIEDWPEFGFAIGGRGANHKDSDEHVWIKLDDVENPVVRAFGGEAFDYRDEFFRVHDTYSRNRVRVLLSIDTDKTDVKQGQPRGNCYREDNDYALAWIRNYGRGRAFYCTIAHNPYVFWDARMLEFYLAAIQFALGDLSVPTTPSARLTPAVRAQEKLGWKLGVNASASGNLTLDETIRKTAGLGLPYMGAASGQKISPDDPRQFGPGLGDAELCSVRLKLEAAGVRLLTYHVQMPGERVASRQLFEFGRKMGIETFIADPDLKDLPMLDELCQEYGIDLALHTHDAKASSRYRNPEGMLKDCRDRSRHIGVCGDVGAWLHSGFDPVNAARILKDRLMVVYLHDLSTTGRDAQEVSLGQGIGKTGQFLRELARLGAKPAMFSLEFPAQASASPPGLLGTSIDFFNATTLKLN